jgi:hypothetical protein
MANFSITGKLFRLNDTIQRTENFSNRSFILEIKPENSNYSEFVTFEAVNDNCKALNGAEIGQTINVKINLKGRKEKNGDRYFNTIEAWDIAFVGGN